MSSEGRNELLLTVRAAEKRDAGRGVARVPESARKALGVLSGDTVFVEGSGRTVVKVWPADGDVPDGVIQIDADARANAGTSVGDTVRVYAEDVEDAATIRLQPPSSLESVPAGIIQRAITRDLEGHPVSVGERIRLERISGEPFRIVETTPDSPVRITSSTEISVDSGRARGPTPRPSGTDTGAASGEASGEPGGVTYEDIGGLDDELELVREMVELPLSEPDLFRKLNIDPPRGVLLYGPPGTGKTLIAKAVANEVDASFHHVSGPEIMSKYKGESEEKIRETFQAARDEAPSIVFFDEIDSIAGKRDEDADVENRVVAQLLSLMDGLESRGDVVVIGATNRVDAIDPALRRGGRFDREIEIGVPGEAGRREILDVHTRGMPLADDVDLDLIARRTHGFVGADLDSVVSEAAMIAIRNRPTEETDRAEWNRNPVVSRSDFEGALASVEPSAMREYVAEKPNVDFSDVGGLEEAKQTLREAIEWPLAYGPLFEAARTTPPSGVLLHGPPGTGKTLLARALAGESGVNFIRVDGPELLDRYVGESEKAVRKVFERARQSAPSILFLDEVDAVAGQRGTDTHEVTERVVSQLLTELDSLAENPNLVVLAATNRRNYVDDALLRPGRLDTHILVPEPDEAGRRKILEVKVDGKPLGDGVDLDELAAATEGLTGADIDALVRDASMRAIRELAEGIPPEEANERTADLVIRKEHFEAALDRLERE
ncbi:AAA family ATPase [Haloarchaeobius sp. HRN-SO-5]|uniref:AAA family ATPase n=1 Tax=Haloarchaeobius sp. HRN-SO-5 TaxID=3446118 RepID=UPI003EB9FA34